MIVGRELEILNGLFSNVGVGDFLDLPFQFPLGTLVPNNLETSNLRVDQPSFLI
jgi:hypothetical protein